MEVENKKNNRFCCELVWSSSYATKSILILILSLSLYLITTPIVRADTELINDDISQSIIDYAKDNIDLTWLVNWNITPAKKAEIQTILQTASATSLTNCFNNNLKNLLLNADPTITKDNMSVAIIYDGYTSDDCLWFVFFASKDNMAGSYWLNAGNKRISFRRYNNNTWYRFRIKLNSDGTFSDYSSSLVDTIETAEFITNDSDIEINNNKVTIPGYYSFSNNQKFYLNNDYYSNNYNLYYNNTYYTIPQNIVNTDQSPYGYLWSPATNGEHRVNLLYSGNTIIDCDYFIGNNLSHTYNFYYMSGENKISVNDYISYGITNTESGEWYKYYITGSNKEYLKDNTHYLLDVSASYGNESVSVVEGFNAFYTISEIIPTATPIPTTTPTATPVPNIGTISGQINDINNNITNSTETIINTISGETEEIKETITKEITSGELDTILPLSGDYVKQMGYKPQISKYNGFIINIYDIIKEALLGTGNVNLYVEYHGYQEYIASDRFYIPNNPFKAWLTAGMIALICWQIAKFGDQITQKLEKADINVIHFADADMYFF